MKRIVWIRADDSSRQDTRKKIVTTALENNFTNIIIRNEDKKSFQKLGKFNLIFIDDGKIRIGNKNRGEVVAIKAKSDQDNAIDLAGKTDHVVVSARTWKVIPVENLIASFQKTKTKLLAEVSNLKDAKLYLETLEVGVDGIVFNTPDLKKVRALRKFIDELEVTNLKLISAKITKIKSIGTGDRVCIDTCSILNIGEGLLVGSQSNGLFLVHSESVESEYVATRPFRVNAGPVHAYILAIGDKTKYLSDLKAGDEVLAVESTGTTRPVVIGRVKIERRPLVLVEVKYGKKKYNIILQNAETIRLISDGKPISIVDLQEGDPIQMWVDDKGRHFGMKVDESVIEQ